MIEPTKPFPEQTAGSNAAMHAEVHACFVWCPQSVSLIVNLKNLNWKFILDVFNMAAV